MLYVLIYTHVDEAVFVLFGKHTFNESSLHSMFVLCSITYVQTLSFEAKLFPSIVSNKYPHISIVKHFRKHILNPSSNIC